MTRNSILAVIAAASVLAFGGGSAVWAHEPTPAADEICGAQGEQQAENNDDFLCGPDTQGETQEGQKGTEESGSTENGQKGTEESGSKENGQVGAVGGSGATGATGAQGTGQQGQQGEEQEGEH